MKKLIENGHIYSKTEFKDYKFRASYEIQTYSSDLYIVDIYTTNTDKVETSNTIMARTSDKVQRIELLRWVSKEQDDFEAKCVDGLLK